MGINEIKNTFPEGSYVKTSFKVIDDKTGDLVDCNCVFLVDHYGEPDEEYVIDAEVAYAKYGIDGDGVFSYGESYDTSISLLFNLSLLPVLNLSSLGISFSLLKKTLQNIQIMKISY